MCGPLLQGLPSSSRKLLSRSVPARRGRSGALIGGKEPSSAKPRRPSATDCGGSIPRSRKARADMWSRRRSSNRRQNGLRPPTRRDRRQPNDSQYQAIEPPNRGGGGQEKTEDQPHAPALTPGKMISRAVRPWVLYASRVRDFRASSRAGLIFLELWRPPV